MRDAGGAHHELLAPPPPLLPPPPEKLDDEEEDELEEDDELHELPPELEPLLHDREEPPTAVPPKLSAEDITPTSIAIVNT